MHNLGKGLAVLVVILAIAAGYISARVLETRNSWMERVDTAKQSVAEQAVELVTERRRLKEMRAELDRTLVRWNRSWNDVAVLPSVGGNRVFMEADLGFNSGLGEPIEDAAGGPVVYGFQLDTEGNAEYMGAFRATTIRENQAALVPTWKLRDGDTDAWTGDTWRFRKSIPASYRTRYSDLRTNVTGADELLAAKLSDLAESEQRVEQARQHLEYRIGELTGGSGAPQGDPGLVAKIQEEENERNLELAEVDRLRRDVHRAKRLVEGLLKSNEELVQRMSRPAAQGTADVSAP